MSAPDAWSPPRDDASSPSDAPRPGMTRHAVRPEARAKVTRAIVGATAAKLSVLALILCVVLGALTWRDGDLVGTAISGGCLLAVFATMGAVTIRRSVAAALNTTVWADDHGLIVRRPGFPDYRFDRSATTRVEGDATHLVVRGEGAAGVRLAAELSGWEDLSARVVSWHPDGLAPPAAVKVPVWRWAAGASVLGLYVVHMAAMDPWIVTLTGLLPGAGMGWALVSTLRNPGLPPTSRIAGLLVVLPLASVVAKIAVVWLLPVP